MKSQYVLFTIEDFRIGCVVAFINQYCFLVRKQERITIVIGFPGNALGDANLFSDAIQYVVPKNSSGSYLWRLVNIFTYLFSLCRIFKKYQVCHIHMGTTKAALLTLMCPYSWITRKTITFYGDWALEVLSFRSTLSDRTIHLLRRKFLQWVTLKAAKRIIVFSKYARDIVIACYPFISIRNIAVIPGAINVVRLVKVKTDCPQIKH